MLNFLKRKTNEPILKYLAQVEGSRIGSLPKMKKEEFEPIRDAVQEIVLHFAPSGSNGRATLMAAAIKEYFVNNKIDADAYWTEVWIRGGRKALDNYNGRQINSAI